MGPPSTSQRSLASWSSARPVCFVSATIRSIASPSLSEHPAPCSSSFGQQHQQRLRCRTCAFRINRREALEAAWQRQEEQEKGAAQLCADLLAGQVVEAQDLEQLSTLLEAVADHLVVVFFYSKTCGICKVARERFQELALESRRQKARVAFLQHNVLDPYDHVSDVARFHKVKAVPCFLFLDEGAVVERLSLRDIRRLAGSQAMIQGAMSADLKRLKRTFWQVLLRCAPSAR